MSDTMEREPGNQGETISLGDEERVRQVLAGTLLGLWEIVNDLSRLRPSRHAALREHHERWRVGQR